MKRPHSGEPLPIDLLNTVWIERGATVDALDNPADLSAWLTERHLSFTGNLLELAEPLHRTREAIRQALLEPDKPAVFDAINTILAYGHFRESLGAKGPEAVVEVEEERWRIPWLAAHELVELLRSNPARVRKCESDTCGLWFFDTTKSATRRWCSMQSCGNRSKVRRYRAQQSDHES